MHFILLLLAFFIGYTKRNTNSVFAASAFSMILVGLYNIMHAPDLSITEATVSLSLGTALYMMALLYNAKIKTKQIHKLDSVTSDSNGHIAGIIIIIAMVALYVALVKILAAIPVHNGSNIGHLYIQAAKKDYHFNSIVTAIVAGYRAFDTLFESIVIFVASIGFYATLLGNSRGRDDL